MTVYLSQERRLFLGICAKYPNCFELVEENVTIQAYQTYIVEQWVPDRAYQAKSIVSFTGDKRHEVSVCSIRQISSNLAEDCKEWQDILHSFESCKAKPMDTPEGKLFVVSLSQFPTIFNIIHVPDGDLESHMSVFHLNLNLKRLGCSGRNALTIQLPSNSQKDRFQQIYKTSPSVEVAKAVFEMIRLVQASLYLISFLPRSLIDGLLCDSTLDALKRFNQQFGPFEREVPESLCDPVMLTALLSKIIAVKNKLSALGLPCPKNPFQDLTSFSSAILLFQKMHKVKQTSLLDIDTLDKIEDVFQHSNPSALKVPRVLKSKLEDISGHPHHQQGDLETTNLDEFITNSHVDVVRALWGKKKKPSTTDVLMEGANLAEGIIQGGKELGKNLFKRAPRMPESQKERHVIRGFRDGVVEGFSRISNSVEGFVDRRRPRLKKHGRQEKSDTEAFNDDLDDYADYPVSAENFGSFYRNDLSQRKYHSLARMAPDKEETARTRSYSMPLFPEVIETDIREVQSFVDKLKKQEMDMVITVKALRQLSNEYALKIQIMSDLYVNNWHGFANTENLLNDLIDQQKLVQNRIDSLELRSSKLQYEISVLEDKMRETDETIDNFRNKITQLDKQVTQGIAFSANFDLFRFFVASASPVPIAQPNE